MISAKIQNLAVLMLMLFGGVSVLAEAAEVPAGVVLADKQQLVRANGSDPASLDPIMSETQESSNVLSDLFAGLVSIDAKGKVQPLLTADWTAQDNRIWTFTLRSDAKWSNGDPITAQDVVYSWQRLASPDSASPYQSYLQTMHVENAEQVINGKLPVEALGVKALSRDRLQVTLTQPVASFLNIIDNACLYPVNEKSVRHFGNKWATINNIVFSGPYKPVQWVMNEKLVLQRNPQYWNNGQTIIDQVTYLPIAEPEAVLNRYLADELDITDSIPTVSFPRLKRSIPEQIRQTPLLGEYYYRFNTAKPPFNDARVRQALSLAVDREIITNKVLGMGQIPAYMLQPTHIGNTVFTAPDLAHWPQAQRLQKAQQLLAEAGFSLSHPLKVTLLYNTQQDHQRIAIAIASFWKKLPGVQVSLQNQEWKALLQTTRSGNF